MSAPGSARPALRSFLQPLGISPGSLVCTDTMHAPGWSYHISYPILGEGPEAGAEGQGGRPPIAKFAPTGSSARSVPQQGDSWAARAAYWSKVASPPFPPPRGGWLVVGGEWYEGGSARPGSCWGSKLGPSTGQTRRALLRFY